MMDYSYLPDRMREDELYPLFYDLLKQTEFSDDAERIFIFDQLYELCVRQVFTYKTAPAELVEKVSTFLLMHMNQESLEMMDAVMAIVPILGLNDVYWVVVNSMETIRNPGVLKLIMECREEYGADYGDFGAEVSE